MSSFICDKCGAEIVDSRDGYVTECIHYPSERLRKAHTIAAKNLSDTIDADLLAKMIKNGGKA